MDRAVRKPDENRLGFRHSEAYVENGSRLAKGEREGTSRPATVVAVVLVPVRGSSCSSTPRLRPPLLGRNGGQQAAEAQSQLDGQRRCETADAAGCGGKPRSRHIRHEADGHTDPSGDKQLISEADQHSGLL